MEITLPFKTKTPETQMAVSAAIKAGLETLKIYMNDFTVRDKGVNDLVTDADLKSDSVLNGCLSEFPYPILSEERIIQSEINRVKDRLWIIDPLDGTKEFINKNGEFSVMVALVDKEEPIIGVVYQPANDTLFVAQKGMGAFRRSGKEWFKMEVDGHQPLGEAIAVMSRSHISEVEKKILGELKISKVVSKGSCGLKIAEICSRSADLYFTTTNKIKIWDTCAGYCLISESGGKMTDVKGNTIRYNPNFLYHENGVLVTNGKLHDKIVGKINQLLNI